MAARRKRTKMRKDSNNINSSQGGVSGIAATFKRDGLALLAILIAAASLLLSSCSDQTIMFDENYEENTNSINQKAIDEAKKNNPNNQPEVQLRDDSFWPTYKVATLEYFPPFVMRDELRIPTGFDVELLVAIGKAEKFNLVFIPQSWSTALSNLDNETRQIVASGVAMTPERLENYEFSDSYLETGFGALVNLKGDPEIAKAKNLDELIANPKVRFATQTGTSAKDELLRLLKGNKKRIVEVPNQFDELKLLIQNDVEAVFDLSAVLQYYKDREQSTHKGEFNLIEDTTAEPMSLGFAVKKGNTGLAKKINMGLKAIKEDGTYDAIKAKWFGGARNRP